LGNQSLLEGVPPAVNFVLTPEAALLQPITIGGFEARNRIFMAPMTRSRSESDGTPSQLQVEYYTQRAGAGLIIGESTAVSAVGNGAYLNTPGIYTDRHQQGWAAVASSVHEAGGRMFLQLWHVGRMGHPNINGGLQPVGPSPISANVLAHTSSGKKPLPVKLSIDEIADIAVQFRHAARRAIDAGMDGVEIHAGNGYLLHQFLSDTANHRSDRYGGSAENRSRLTVEVIGAVVAEIGANRVGLRISPGNPEADMQETDKELAYLALLHRIAPLNIAYLHLLVDPADPVFEKIRGMWAGALVLNTGKDVPTDFYRLDALVDRGVISAISAGRAYLANPDLLERLRSGSELDEPISATLYSKGPQGYTDYPTLSRGPGDEAVA
jgi:N-ethylmaleimide reductase